MIMSKPRFVICAQNEGYEASLELRKLYREVPDADAKAQYQIRIIDESGDDYLYPAEFFIPIDLPTMVATKIERMV